MHLALCLKGTEPGAEHPKPTFHFVHPTLSEEGPARLAGFSDIEYCPSGCLQPCFSYSFSKYTCFELTRRNKQLEKAFKIFSVVLLLCFVLFSV